MRATQAPEHPVARREIVRIARRWIGTPYHHQASLQGVGADCLGLLRGIWRELYGVDAEIPPAYSRDWAEACGREELIAGAGRHLIPVQIHTIQPADVLLFRMREGAPAKHVGLLTGPTTFIHATEGAPVREVALQNWWRRRVVSAFGFPGVID